MISNQPVQQVSPSLFTDRYEFSMLAAAIHEGIADTPAVFEAFARHLPTGRRYGLLAGLGRLLPLIEAFTFSSDEVGWLLTEGIVDAATADYLRDFRFTGTVHGLREGDVYFPGTPVLTVECSLGQGYLLETLVLSVLNHDVAIASAAARMVTAAGGRPIIEMGSRRVHEQAAVAVARAAYVAGFGHTSNLAASYVHGIPSKGTAAHALTRSTPTVSAPRCSSTRTTPSRASATPSPSPTSSAPAAPEPSASTPATTSARRLVGPARCSTASAPATHWSR
jgi:nicotinate phosphoribosyltransferase